MLVSGSYSAVNWSLKGWRACVFWCLYCWQRTVRELEAWKRRGRVWPQADMSDIPVGDYYTEIQRVSVIPQVLILAISCIKGFCLCCSHGATHFPRASSFIDFWCSDMCFSLQLLFIICPTTLCEPLNYIYCMNFLFSICLTAPSIISILQTISTLCLTLTPNFANLSVLVIYSCAYLCFCHFYIDLQ